MKLLILHFVLSSYAIANVKYFGIHKFHFGHTSNANLEPDGDENSDTYWGIYTKNGLTTEGFSPQLDLAYKDYLHEDQNDFFSFDIGVNWRMRYEKYFNPQAFFSFFSNKYIHRDSGATAVSFSHKGFRLGAKNDQTVNRLLIIGYGLTYTFRDFTNFIIERKDKSLRVSFNFDYIIPDMMDTYGDFSIQSTSSSLSFYDNQGFTLGGGADKAVIENLSAFAELYLTHTSYPNRVTETGSEVDTKSNRSNSNITEEKDDLLELSLGANYNYLKSFNFGLDLSFKNNSSNNDLAKYDEIQINFNIGYKFKRKIR